MSISIDKSACPLPLSSDLVALLEEEMEKAGVKGQVSTIINFRDPEYSAEHGGFHPVEIRINPKGRIQYITDFAFVGLGPQAELAKEIDFDFSLGLFQHYGREYPLERGRELFALWQENFVSYFHMGLFTVTVEEDG